MRNADASGPFERVTASAEETRALAARLGALLRLRDLVLLEGGLGAGKTVFVQGLARGLELATPVKSPTFTLLHEYRRGDGRAPLAHLDLYRIPAGRDVTDLALDELLDRSAVVVEWGGRLAASYPEHVLVALAGPDPARAPDERRVSIEGRGARGTAVVLALRSALDSAGDDFAAGQP